MSDVSNPAGYADAVTPSDATVLGSPTRAIYVGGTGNLAVRMYRSQQVVTFAAVPVGILPIQVDKVMNTNTTATNIVALY